MKLRDILLHKVFIIPDDYAEYFIEHYSSPNNLVKVEE